MELIKQKDHLWCLWDILECQQKKLVKGKGMNYICISAFGVAPAGLKYAFSLLFIMVLSSGNSIVCFRWKNFLKSDMLTGFTTSVALICYVACVISWKFDFFSNYFNLALCIFPGFWPDASVPHIPQRLRKWVFSWPSSHTQDHHVQFQALAGVL